MNLLPVTPDTINLPAVISSGFLTGLCHSILTLYPVSGPVFPWVGYFCMEQDIIVGTCAFKSLPKNGVVEIAYFTFPGYEGQGKATRMASELVAIAGSQKIQKVIAQTLPEHNASTRILQKLQFTFADIVQHPDDGEVWEWEYSFSIR
ncbi:MAG TPA: GNAT family protein [Cellvibrio sp.]|nr:GNAT family protein [Cellvibrio sp.]